MAATAGCTFRRAAYVSLKWYVPHTLDKWFDLSSSQSKFIKERLGDHVEWHRRTELPRYILYIEKNRELTKRAVSAEEVERVWGEFDKAWALLEARLHPDVVSFLLTLQPQQLDHYQEYIETTYKTESKDMSVSKPVYIKKREKGLRDRTEMWIGKLSPFQVRTIAEYVEGSYPFYMKRPETKKLRHHDFLAFLRGRPSAKVLDETVSRYLLPGGFTATGKGREEGTVQQRRTAAFISKLSSELSKGQRAHLQDEVDELLSDLRALAD